MSFKKTRITKKSPILAVITAAELRKLLSQYKDNELITIMIYGGIAAPLVIEKPTTSTSPNIEVAPAKPKLPVYNPPRHPNPKAPMLLATIDSYKLHTIKLSKRIRPLYVSEDETKRKSTELGKK